MSSAAAELLKCYNHYSAYLTIPAVCLVVQVFRATHGKAQVWGKAPTYITAKYSPADGQEKTSLLLTSGGLAAGHLLVNRARHIGHLLLLLMHYEATMSRQPC